MKYKILMNMIEHKCTWKTKPSCLILVSLCQNIKVKHLIIFILFKLFRAMITKLRVCHTLTIILFIKTTTKCYLCT